MVYISFTLFVSFLIINYKFKFKLFCFIKLLREWFNFFEYMLCKYMILDLLEINDLYYH